MLHSGLDRCILYSFLILFNLSDYWVEVGRNAMQTCTTKHINNNFTRLKENTILSSLSKAHSYGNLREGGGGGGKLT